MDIEVRPGRYVVAVSGGVDSMSLLHKLTTLADIELIVAHFDHGIRPDSIEDRKLVQQFSSEHGLVFTYQNGALGPQASEAVARRARYEFLHQTRRMYDARAIITAHHQGDVLETAIMNMLRGTNRRGLSSLGDSTHIRRPLLHVDKQQIQIYAAEHEIPWREDSTNSDERYLRNYVRHRLLPHFSDEQKRQLAGHISDLRLLNTQLDGVLANVLHLQTMSAVIDRPWFIGLPHAVARELLATWLRGFGVKDFDKKTLERLVVAAKTARAGTHHDVIKGWQLVVAENRLALRKLER